MTVADAGAGKDATTPVDIGTGEDATTQVDTGTGEGATIDTGTDEDAATGPEGGTIIGMCDPSGNCPDGSTCVFPIGSCEATGQCYEDFSENCGARSYLCGCDGATVTAGCGTFGGATGPTTGASSMFPLGSSDDDYCPEPGTSGPDAAVDAMTDADGSCETIGAVSQAPCSPDGRTCSGSVCETCACQGGVWRCAVCSPPPGGG
jgi:hypothetical protein